MEPVSLPAWPGVSYVGCVRGNEVNTPLFDSHLYTVCGGYRTLAYSQNTHRLQPFYAATHAVGYPRTKFVALGHCGSGDRKRGWGMQKWRELVEILLSAS